MSFFLYDQIIVVFYSVNILKSRNFLLVFFSFITLKS